MDQNESESVEKVQRQKAWKGWKGWKALSAVAAVAIAIFAGLNYFTSNSTLVVTEPIPKIVATVCFKSLNLPSSCEDALRSLHRPGQISADKKIAALVQKLPEESRKNAIDVISGYIASHMPYYLGRGLYNIEGWWDIDVENHSDMTVFDVVVEIPGLILVTEVYSKSKGLVELTDNRDYVKLGDIRAREKVSVRAWSADRLLVRLSEKVKLTHKNGIGEVLMK